MSLKDKINFALKFLFLGVFTYGVISLTCCSDSCATDSCCSKGSKCTSSVEKSCKK